MVNKKVKLLQPLTHVAFIMDGNGRWAKQRGLPRHMGHKEACNRIIEVFDLCKEYGIKVTSFYAFSTENWNRPKDEIKHLFQYLELFFKKEIEHLKNDGVRIIISGDISKLPKKTQKTCQNAIESTKNNSTYYFNICLNYGGRDEIVRAANLAYDDLKNGTINELTVQNFGNYLYTKDLPDVDLMIRTSGEVRLSNFLLWQNSYAEFVFLKDYWPDFKRPQFEAALEEYNSRIRRFGGLNK